MKVLISVALLSICLAATAWPQTQGTIAGRVVDTAGAPVASVKVDIVEIGKVQLRRLHFGRYQTDAEGLFKIEHVLWGTYGVETSKEDEGFANTALGFYNTKPVVVTLSAAAPNRELTVNLGPAAGILDASAVVDAVTGVHVDASITLRRQDSGTWMNASSTVKKILIPSGTPVTIEISATGYTTWYYPGTTDASRAAPLTLQPEQKIEIPVALQPTNLSPSQAK